MIAIIITIMVLDLKIPHGADWEVLQPVLPVFLVPDSRIERTLAR